MTTDLPEHRRVAGVGFDEAAVARAWHQSVTSTGYATPATEMMLDLAGLKPGDRVLDVAAGTGDQTLMAARRVGPTGTVVATDIAPNMLAVAADSALQAGVTTIETRVMDAQQLDFDDGSFDAAICRLGLMLVPEPRLTLAGVFRLLKPGGRFVALIPFGGPSRNRGGAIPYEVVRRVGNLPSLEEKPPTAGSFNGPGQLEAAFRDAGFQEVAGQVIGYEHRRASAAAFAAETKARLGPLREEMAALSPEEQERAWVEIEQELRQFEGPDGFVVPGEFLIVVGSKEPAGASSGASQGEP